VVAVFTETHQPKPGNFVNTTALSPDAPLWRRSTEFITGKRKKICTY